MVGTMLSTSLDAGDAFQFNVGIAHRLTQAAVPCLLASRPETGGTSGDAAAGTSGDDGPGRGREDGDLRRPCLRGFAVIRA